MYQLFFRTANLLLLLYPLLLIKNMTYSLAIRFFSQSLVMRYRALNNAPHRRYLTEFWNFGYGLRVKRKEKYLHIWECNNIKNNSDVWQDSKCAYVSINGIYLVQLFQVLLQAYSDVFEHYPRAYSRIFRTLSIAGMFRTLSYFYYKAYTDSKEYSQYQN